MSFLKDLFSGAWNGLETGVRSLGRGINDLAQGDFKSAGSEIEGSYKGFSSIPGLGFTRGLYKAANGDMSLNPFSDETSVWDYQALGNAAYDPKNRQIGRMIGTVVGSIATGGALAGMYGPVMGSAINGAGWAAAQTAGTGGDLGDVAKNAIGGAAAGGLSGGIAAQNPAGYLGVTNKIGQAAINSGIGDAVTTAARGGDMSAVGRSGLTGAALGGLNALGETKMWNPNPNSYTSNEFNGMFATEPGQVNSMFSPSSSSTSGSSNPFNDYLQSALGFMGQTQPNGRSRWGQTAEGLLGLYMANRQRRDASRMLSSISGNSGAYAERLRSNMLAKDAASGRRSNFAGRETQLQASLAELASRNAPAINQLTQQKYGGYLGMMNNGMNLANASGAFRPSFTPVPQQSFNMPEQLQTPQESTVQPYGATDQTPPWARRGKQWGGY